MATLINNDGAHFCSEFGKMARALTGNTDCSGRAARSLLSASQVFHEELSYCSSFVVTGRNKLEAGIKSAGMSNCGL